MRGFYSAVPFESLRHRRSGRLRREKLINASQQDQLLRDDREHHEEINRDDKLPVVGIRHIPARVANEADSNNDERKDDQGDPRP